MAPLQTQLREHETATAAEARESLDRLLQSQVLESRARLREFLEFVGRLALEGRQAEIKEQAIGSAVFGRPPEYSIHEDTIVRVTARQLRQKIEEYYRTEGHDDRWIVEIPKGTYVPVFRPRPDAVEPEAKALPDPVPDEKPARAPWLMVALLLVLAAAVLLLVTSPTAEREPTLLSLLQPETGHRVSVVCGDAVVQIYKDLAGVAPTVDQFSSGAYLESGVIRSITGEQNTVWETVKDRRILATGSLQAIVPLLQGMPESQVVVRHPRDVTVRDLMDDNAILLSGPFANPWVQLFEQDLNFRIEQGPDHIVYIRNVAPQPGEQPEYRLETTGSRRRAYARLAYLPNLSGRGKALLIGGPSSILMELMGDAVVKPEFLKEMAARFGVKDEKSLPFCEILMEVIEMGGAPVETRIVAVRRVAKN